jgi:hypothetical protein
MRLFLDSILHPWYTTKVEITNSPIHHQCFMVETTNNPFTINDVRLNQQIAQYTTKVETKNSPIHHQGLFVVSTIKHWWRMGLFVSTIKHWW